MDKRLIKYSYANIGIASEYVNLKDGIMEIGSYNGFDLYFFN